MMQFPMVTGIIRLTLSADLFLSESAKLANCCEENSVAQGRENCANKSRIRAQSASEQIPAFAAYLEIIAVPIATA